MNEKKKIMRGLPKRILSFALTLALVFTLMPGMTLSASAAGSGADWTASECEFCPAGGDANAKLVLTGVTSSDGNPPESITIDLGAEFTNIESFEEAYGEDSCTLSMEPIDGEEGGYVEESCFSFRVVNEQHIIFEMEVRYNDGNDICVTLSYSLPEDDDEFVLKYDNGKIKQVKRPVVERITIADDGTATINDKTYKADGTPDDEDAPALNTLGLAYSYDATNGAKLTVNGVDGVGPVIKSSTTQDAIFSEVDLEIELNVDTIVKCNDDDDCHQAIRVSGDLKITGEHNLTATALGDVIYAENITIDVDNLTAVAKGEDGCGIIAEGTLNILGDTSLEVSGIDFGLAVLVDLVLNHTGTVTVCGGFAVMVYNSVTTTKTGGLLAYGTDTAFETLNVDGMPEMLGSDEMWTAQNQVEPATPIHWVGQDGPEDPHKIACVMVDSEPALAKTVKLGAINPPAPPAPPAPSGGGSSTPTITVPVTGDENTVKVQASVSGSTATVKDITEEDLNKVSGGGNVEIDLSGLSKNIDSAKIPAATVEKIAEQSGMTVKLSTATVTFDRDASASITEQAQGETIELVVDDIKKDSLNTAQKEAVKDIKMAIVIDAYLVSGGARICSSDKGGFGKGEATVILPYDIKDSASKHSVYYIDDKGKLENLNARYDENLKSFVFKISHFSNYAIAYDESAVSSFVDVPAGEYYYDAVKWAAANGITAGIDDTHFGPSLGTTRAQVVTFLWRMAGSPEPAGNANKFADVKAGSYYEKAVAWAIEEGITNGTAATAFSPESTCTRGQIVTFLYRFAGIDTSDVKDNPFIDVADGQFYHDAALWAAENGITTGVSKNLFSPDSSCIRAEIVTFLYRYMGK